MDDSTQRKLAVVTDPGNIERALLGETGIWIVHD